MNTYRTHHCGELNENNIDQTVKLAGWIHRKRDHGGLLFIDLRDQYGITQIVFDIDKVDLVAHLHVESVISIAGQVVARSAENINEKLATGKIEVLTQEVNVESEAEVIPFPVHNDENVNEEIRLKNRFLDLRREKMKNNILLRNKVIAFIRQEMIEMGFYEFQTPILTASSPEGARDFLVPSRFHPGKFYALPQAPQQFKQLLMASGFDKYFQIAPCFRDENVRTTRSLEFYQLDMEMAFVTRDDIFAVMEPLMIKVFEHFSEKKVLKPFSIIAYDQAMLDYGTDKPDLRNPLKIKDLTEIFRDSTFDIFRKGVAKGMKVRAISVENIATKSRSFFDKKIEFVKKLGGSGLAYITFDENGEAKGPIAKLMNEEILSQIKEAGDVKNNGGIFFVCDMQAKAELIAGEVRILLGKELNLLDENVFAFCWIVDFPYFEYNEWMKKIDFAHNPFSMPYSDLSDIDINNIDKEKLFALRANQYDIVCNGHELSSGAIRNHKPELIYKAFAIVGYDREFVDEKFGCLLKAFRFGVPPHGGIAPGIERIVMLLANAENIRDVTAFPMNQQAEDLLMGSPSTVNVQQLKDLGIALDIDEEN